MRIVKHLNEKLNNMINEEVAELFDQAPKESDTPHNWMLLRKCLRSVWDVDCLFPDEIARPWRDGVLVRNSFAEMWSSIDKKEWREVYSRLSHEDKIEIYTSWILDPSPDRIVSCIKAMRFSQEVKMRKDLKHHIEVWGNQDALNCEIDDMNLEALQRHADQLRSKYECEG